MIGIVCDNCLKTNPVEHPTGWVAMQRVVERAPDPLTALFGQQPWLSSTPEPAEDPLKNVRHFCGTSCAVNWLSTGMVSLLERTIAPPPEVHR